MHNVSKCPFDSATLYVCILMMGGAQHCLAEVVKVTSVTCLCGKVFLLSLFDPLEESTEHADLIMTIQYGTLLADLLW